MINVFKRIHNDVGLMFIGKMQPVAQKYEGSRYYFSIWLESKTKSLYTVLIRAMEDEDLPVVEVTGKDEKIVMQIEEMICTKYESDISEITRVRDSYMKTKLAHVMTNGY